MCFSVIHALPNTCNNFLYFAFWPWAEVLYIKYALITAQFRRYSTTFWTTWLFF
jgi:hypothetical protein